MLVPFDHGTPAPLLSFLQNHVVRKAKDMGWDTLTNGEFLQAAEKAGFEVLLTTDKNIRYQQNLTGRKIAIVVLANPRWPISAALCSESGERRGCCNRRKLFRSRHT